MLPYYLTFLISVLSCYVGETWLVKEQTVRSPQKHRGTLYVKKSYVFLCISVLSVSLLAGMRGYSVGTDIHSYVLSLFFGAKRFDSIIAYIKAVTHIEPLYLALTYISAQFSKEPHLLLFLTGLITYSFMMVFLTKMRKQVPLTMAWLGFLCLLYGDTYNAMRQAIAIGIGMMGFYYGTINKKKTFVIFTFIALLFHNTAFIFFGIYLVYCVLQKFDKLWTKVAILMTSVLIVVGFNEILQALINIGILNAKFERYYIDEVSAFSMNAILIRIPFLLLAIVESKRFQSGTNSISGIMAFEKKGEGDFYIMMLIMEMFTILLSVFLPSLYRISLYFIPFRFISYARIVGVQKKKNKIAMEFLLIIYFLIVFIYQNQIKGNNEIYPYIFWFMD